MGLKFPPVFLSQTVGFWPEGRADRPVRDGAAAPGLFSKL